MAGVKWSLAKELTTSARRSTARGLLTRLLDWRRIVGNLETLRGNIATGWIWDPREPDAAAFVEFRVDGQVIHTVQAHLFREDVRNAGFGSGNAGFRAELPIELSRQNGVSIHARLAGTRWVLRGSPRRLIAHKSRQSKIKLSSETALGLREPLHVPNASQWRLPDPPVKAIAFYLPQFHPIAENDRWWGKGFTEWTNVTRGAPQFPGHYQPHRPGELGYYDLRIADVQVRQAELASLYGLSGFCFYFYWFSGHVLLESPIRQFARNPAIDFPFCLCWANENWTRRWDGLDSEILISQNYSSSDDFAFIEHVSQYFLNNNYIRIDGKPVLLIYRAELIPNPTETVNRWREYCRSAGIGEIYLACTQSFSKNDPRQGGFDAAVEFPPNNSGARELAPTTLKCNADYSGLLFDYTEMVDRSRNLSEPDYPLHRGAFPSWDNSARRRNGGTIFVNSSPESYQRYLENVSRHVMEQEKSPERRLVFINAWNEWAEGAHLEPDERHGYAYLEATRMALIRAATSDQATTRRRFGAPGDRPRLAVIVHAYYPDVLDDLLPLFREYDSDVEFFFTTPPDKVRALAEKLSKLKHANTIWALDNKGRDIAPFLVALQRIWSRKFRYILKLHTKRSTHRPDGDSWRNDIYQSLATPDQVSAILGALEHRPEVGVVGPAGHVVPMTTYWGSNRDLVLNLCRRLGIDEVTLNDTAFVAGTMFFAKLEALEPLIGLGLTAADFEEEEGQMDGTLAHAIERAIALSAAAASLVVCGAQTGVNGDTAFTAQIVSSYQYADGEA